MLASWKKGAGGGDKALLWNEIFVLNFKTENIEEWVS
jgi:hypothetical protein